jgi:autotransporter passenger strand-loop-strand repeat protein
MSTFTVTNLNDSGAGSLRAAITALNSASPGSANTIDFSVSGTITLASGLPTIVNAVSIVASGTTAGSAPTVGINFNGNAGLVFSGGSQGSQVIGLSLGGATGNGVTLNVGNVTLNNNYIGLALDGSARGNTGDGVYVAATSSGNNIGSNPDALSGIVTNVISANGGNGISFHGSADNTVESNRIGTNIAGTAAMANGSNGIWVTDASNGNLIGGTAYIDSNTGAVNNPTGNKGTVPAVIVTPPLGNLVSGNAGDGIRIDAGSENNVLSGNFVGTAVGGNTALGNQGDGVAIVSADNNSLIGCTFVDQPFIYYNVISGNGDNGVHVTDADNILIQANFVGVGANNASMVGNGNDGILIDGASQNTQVGGVIPLGNVISGNEENGIEVAGTASGFTTFNTFGGVYAFQGAAPNGNDGVLITSTGGNQTVRTNVLSGNLNNGLEIGGDAWGVTVVPNIIGLNTRGDAIIANGNNGVLITGTAHDNLIGGDGGDQISVIRQNTFSGNGSYGVSIAEQAYNNIVKNGAIGTNIQESAALPNEAGGVLISSTGTGNVIGAALTGWSPAPSPSVLVNIVSGNNGNGITLGSGARGDAIINNWIGLDLVGAPTLPNTGLPIQTNANHNLVYGNSATGSLPLESPTGQLQALYIGWFGWAADPESFQLRMQSFLTEVLNGASLMDASLTLSEDFATSPELAPYAPLASLVTPVTNPTPEQIALANSFINRTFTNLFGHTADTVALTAWRTALFNGTVPFSAMVYDIANGATGSDVTAINSKIEAAIYFTAAHERGPAGIAAVSGVVDTTTMLASQAATNAEAGTSHTGITFQSILDPYDITTGVRAGLDGSVILTGSQASSSGSATQAFLFEGPLNNTDAGTKYLLTPTFGGQTITTATFYGPDTSIFTPSIGLGNVRAVGSYQYAQSTSGTINHGMIYEGAVSGGGTWTQIDVPTNGANVVGGIVLGGQIEDTILHSNQGELAVGNYDLVGDGPSANGFIYNMTTHQYTLMSINGSMRNLTTLYGIWQNGVGSTSYTIAGGTYVAASGINEAFLEHYDSATGVFSDLTFYTGYNLPGVITHFENITAVPGGYNLVATTTTGPAFASIVVNADGTFGSATWAPIALPGSSLLTGNIAYQNVVGGIYNTTDANHPATYLGVVDQGHADAAGGRIMPMGSYNFAYGLTVNGSVGDTIAGSTTAGNLLGGSIGNDTFSGTQSASQSDTFFTGGGADTIALAASHSGHDRIELYAGNGLNIAGNLIAGGVVASVYGSIVNAADIPQLGWWGQATGQVGGPVSNASTNAGVGTGTSRDMSTVTNFMTGSHSAAVDTIDISLGAFSNLLRNLGTGSTPGLGSAVFSNLVHLGGTVTVANANVLLIDSATGFANAAAVAAALRTTPITFAGTQTGALNHYIIAYQDLEGDVRIADMDIHASGAFTTTAGGQTLSVSDMLHLSDVSLSSLQPGNITFLTGGGAAVAGQTFTVSSGQTAEDIVVLSGGILAVESGGRANDSVILGGGLALVSGGGVASGTLVSSTGTVEILAGGTGLATVVSNGGLELIFSGGTASNTTVQSGGTEYVYGTAVGVSIQSGGAGRVEAGGVVSGGGVSAGGTETVSSGGLTRGVTVSAQGIEIVSSGGTASGTTVLSNGVALNQGTMVDETLSGGVGYVLSGGAQSATTVTQGGTLVVSAGGVASGTTVRSGGSVQDYGATVGGTVSATGIVYVASGGTASSLVVSSGGTALVYAGGSATGTTVLNGGVDIVYGQETGETISSGGIVYVASGASVTSTTVSSGGNLLISAGGTASATTVLNGGVVQDYGTMRGGAIRAGGVAYLLSGGVASNLSVSSGGFSVVSSGAVANNTGVLSGGIEYVYGSAIGETIGLGGIGYVVSGTATATQIAAGGYQIVSSGASGNGGTVFGTAYDYGNMSGTLIGSGGVVYVVSGAVDSASVISAGGLEIIMGTATGGTNRGLVHLYGSSVSGTIGSGGLTYIVSGGTAISTTISNGGIDVVYAGAVASGTIVGAGGLDYVYGRTVGEVVTSGGIEYVTSGAIASSSVVQSGGALVVYNGGTGSGTVLSGGVVYGYGSTVGDQVGSGGLELVLSGGTASAATVLSGGKMVVSAGATLTGATISGGLLEIESGGTAGTSQVTFTGAGGILQLDDSQHFAGTVAGFGIPGGIDLRDISFGVGTTLSYVDNGTSGTLTVSDAASHSATILLLGQYTAAQFKTQSDGAGGTLVTDPPIDPSSLLGNPH